MEEPGNTEQQFRQCQECKKVWPLNPRYYKRVAGTQTTFRQTCKKCEYKEKKAKKIASIETNAVAEFSRRASMGGSRIPHSSELLEGVMNYFGGVNGFASLLVKQYFEAPAGGRLRTSILDTIVKLTVKNTAQGGARKPVNLYSDEELEAEISKRLEEAVVTINGRTYINGQAEKIEEATVPALPDPNSGGDIQLPTGRIEGTPGGIEREADRSLEAIQANRKAMGVPSVPGQ